MNKKERETFKRDKIRYLWVYQHLSYKDIAEQLNSNPEFIRKCGKIAIPTVAYWVKKIKGEFESMIDNDAMEIFNAEFMRSIEFIDGEMSDIQKIIESNPDMKLDDRLKYINMRHRMEIDKMTLLSDKALPLSVKKWKKDRQKLTKTLNVVDDDTNEIPSIIFKDRVRPKEDG